jgi:hypothetical protein
MINELEIKCKEAVMILFKGAYCPGICLEGLKKKQHKNFSQDSWSPG